MAIWALRSRSTARGRKRRSLRISEATVVARYRVLRWSLVGGLALCILGAPSCLLSFDDYSEGDVCDAGRDAGIRFRSAPDPVLRGCDAGRASDPDSEA